MPSPLEIRVGRNEQGGIEMSERIITGLVGLSLKEIQAVVEHTVPLGTIGVKYFSKEGELTLHAADPSEFATGNLVSPKNGRLTDRQGAIFDNLTLL